MPRSDAEGLGKEPRTKSDAKGLGKQLRTECDAIGLGKQRQGTAIQLVRVSRDEPYLTLQTNFFHITTPYPRERWVEGRTEYRFRGGSMVLHARQLCTCGKSTMPWLPVYPHMCRMFGRKDLSGKKCAQCRAKRKRSKRTYR